MATQSQLAELERQHHALEREIETEMARPGSSDLRISELKRRKLHLKDELERLRQMVKESVH